VANLAGFDATQIEPNDRPEAIPAGKYKCVAIESEFKDTKDGKGKFLQFCFEVIEGEYKGRRLWDRLNLVNSNAEAVNIARRTLSAICHAVNVMQPNDSAQLHNLPMIVKVALTSYNGEPKNEVKGYEKIPRTAPAVATTTTEKAPWA